MKCLRCHQNLPLDSFRVMKRRKKDGVQYQCTRGVCRPCESSMSKNAPSYKKRLKLDFRFMTIGTHVHHIYPETKRCIECKINKFITDYREKTYTRTAKKTGILITYHYKHSTCFQCETTYRKKHRYAKERTLHNEPAGSGTYSEQVNEPRFAKGHNHTPL